MSKKNVAKNVAKTSTKAVENNNKATESKATESKATESKATESKETITLDKCISDIDDTCIKLALILKSSIKELVPCNIDTKTIENEYNKALELAKNELDKAKPEDLPQASLKYAEAVTKAKQARDTALKGGYGNVDASKYEVDKDFLLKAGFETLQSKELCNEYNNMITSLFNVVKYSHSIKHKLAKVIINKDNIGTNKIELAFKHGAYGAKKTFNAVKGKEGLTDKIAVIDILYKALTSQD